MSRTSRIQVTHPGQHLSNRSPSKLWIIDGCTETRSLMTRHKLIIAQRSPPDGVISWTTTDDPNRP